MYRALIVEDDAGIAEAIRRAAGSWDLAVTQEEDLPDVMADEVSVRRVVQKKADSGISPTAAHRPAGYFSAVF